MSSADNIRQLSYALAGAMGLSLLLGGPSRHSEPAYYFMVQTGGAYIWGLWFFALSVGLALLPTSHHLFRMAMYVASGTYVCFGLGFVISAIIFPTANLTAPIVYWWVALLHALLADRLQEEDAHIKKPLPERNRKR